MNWLAHVYLSEPPLEARLGNLLADLVKGRDRAGMSEAFLRGCRLHQAIDAFTDTHPIAHTSRARLSGEQRHASGVLVDVFYDHFLARLWDRYASEPLTTFTQAFYAEVLTHTLPLPAEVQYALDRMVTNDRLASYATLEGVRYTLWRVSQRLEQRTGKPWHLDDGVSELTTHYDALEADFHVFFPELQEHVRRWIATAALM